MINVVVGKKRIININTNATAGIINTNVPVTLKQDALKTASANGLTRLDQMTDVVATSESNGATLVYNSSIDKYIVEKLNLNNVEGTMDGGTF